MKFCSQCENMYYMSISETDTNKLIYYCRVCGNTDETLSTEGSCVLTTEFKQNEQKFSHIINPYTKMDPTLPRIFMKCPNEGCITNKDKPDQPNVIYIRYDDQNLKYVYLCVQCDTVWT